MSEHETPALIPAAQVLERALAWTAALWLVQRRAQRGLSQAALVRQLGVGQPKVARWESGGHVLELTTPLRLADQPGGGSTSTSRPQASALKSRVRSRG